MKKSVFALSALLFVFASLFTSCESVNITSGLSEVTTALVDYGIIDPKSGSAINRSISTIDKAAEEITPEDSYYIGRSVAALVLSSYEIRKSPQMTEYLNSICSALVMNSAVPYAYKGYWVAILDTDEINAMATPGGHIFISKGLIECTDSEDALAAVIAHELSHIQLKHSIQSIQASRGTEIGTELINTALVVAGKEGDGSLETETLLKFSSIATDAILYKGFSQTQEFMADANALEIMKNTGYEPSAMNDMLSLINNGNTTDGGWNKTHPKASDRITEVNKVLFKMNFEGSPKSVRQARFDQIKKTL